jgi:hypothetical protein
MQVAQRLKHDNDDMSLELDQRILDEKMAAALQETARLRDIADDFDHSLVEQKLLAAEERWLQAEERFAELTELRERVQDLEEENAGLNQTLNEYRQSTAQLQALQKLQADAPPAAPVATSEPPAVPAATSVPPSPPPGREESRDSFHSTRSAEDYRMQTVPPVPHVSEAAAAAAITIAEASGPRPPTPAPAAFTAAATAPSALDAKDPAAIADQLVAAAGGATGGIVGSAARMLREHSALEESFKQQQKVGG